MPCRYYRPALLGTLPGEFRLECEPIYHGPTTSQQVGYNNTIIINLPHAYYRRPYLYVSTVIEQAATRCGRYDVASLKYSVLLRSTTATTWAGPVATPSPSSAWIPFRAVDPGLGCLAAGPACLPASLQTIFRRSGSTKRLNSWYEHVPHRGSITSQYFNNHRRRYISTLVSAPTRRKPRGKRARHRSSFNLPNHALLSSLSLIFLGFPVHHVPHVSRLGNGSLSASR